MSDTPAGPAFTSRRTEEGLRDTIAGAWALVDDVAAEATEALDGTGIAVIVDPAIAALDPRERSGD